MSYEGDLLLMCPGDIDFQTTFAIVVSGAAGNPCGHMILCTGPANGNKWYFHVAGQGVEEALGVYAYPKFMLEDGFHRYLRENGKHELRRLDAKLQYPEKAYDRLMTLMSGKWFWGVLIHNCATFVQEVISAGGGDLNVVLNCPDQEVKAVRAILNVESGLQKAERGLQSGIRNLRRELHL